MIRPNHSVPDRRSFLRNASILTAATMGVAKFPHVSHGEESAGDEEPQIDQVEVIDLGAKPTFACSGAVVLPRTYSTYVSFHASRIRSDGRVMGDGTALIQLGVCVDHKQRHGDDSASVDIESLGICDTYEVLNSSWAASWNGVGSANDESPDLRHFIFTFLGFYPGLCERASNFECLAQSATGYFVRSKLYSHVVRYADYLEVRAQREAARAARAASAAAKSSTGSSGSSSRGRR